MSVKSQDGCVLGLFKKILLLTFFISINAAAGNGNLLMFIFNKDFPAARTKISIENKEYYTNSNGLLDLDMKVGHYTASIFLSNDKVQLVNFTISNNEETVVNYTLLDDKVEVKRASEKNTETFLENTLNSTFSGKVVSRVKNKKLAKTKILVHGLGLEFYSDKNGYFNFKIPAGTYSISFISENHSVTTLNDISFKKGIKLVENVILSPSGLELEEFVVLSPGNKSSINALLEVRKGQQSIADLIGAEQISRSGDSDAGSSLKRVTGLSLVDGKYVYVRGLGERYSNTLFNGSIVPSPDPSRRVVPLDLFPASVIETMAVQKGYAPEMPGEFGGGIIEIKTKSIPEKDYTKISLSRNFEDDTAKSTYSSSGRDWTGKDNGARSIPQNLERLVNENIDLSSLPFEQRQKNAQSIRKNYDVIDIEDNQKLPLHSLSFSIGRKYRLGKVKVGTTASTLYSNKWSTSSSDKMNYNQDGIELVEDSNKSEFKTKNEVKLGVLAGIGVKVFKQKLAYNYTMLRNTEKNLDQTTGINSEKEEYRKVDHGFLQRILKSHQVMGEHQFKVLNKSKLNWNYSYSKAILDSPDSKMYVYKKNNGIYELETENGSSSNSISWQYMPDRLRNISFSYKQPVIPSIEVESGINVIKRAREFKSRNFYFKFPDGSNIDTSKNPDEVFSNENVELYQQSNNTDNYKASQKQDSYYGKINLKPFSPLSINVGVRFEKSEQNVESFKLFGQGKTISKLKTTDYFPGASIIYKFPKSIQFKGNYGQTTSRPDLREISNTIWSDSDSGARFIGNPRLDAAKIRNFGGRVEWFFGRGEIISLGYFRKDFEKPIEEIFGALSDDGRIVGTSETQYTFLNIDSATNHGIEFEIRKSLGFGFTAGANYSWIKSDVKISKDKAGQLTSLNRPLQGQSPYLINAQLDFDKESWGSKISLLYNVMGKRITGVGVDARPDEYQEKLSSLDFVAGQKVFKKMSLKLKIKNILDPEIKRVQGKKITYLKKKGRSISLGLSSSF